MTQSQDTQSIADKLLAYLRTKLNTPSADYRISLTQLQGGYETAIYHFELEAVSETLSRPLVLRLYPKSFGSNIAIWESTVQNSLFDQGYPVAHAHVVCTDMAILGGAFIIMDHLPGQPLAFAPPESAPGLLGKTHAELHNSDPLPLITSLREHGIDADRCRLDNSYRRLKGKRDTHTWVCLAINWLLENRPAEPDRLSICHGDFHPLNILYADGQISGVLDWGGLVIADPVYDVGNTAVLMTIAYKHVAASIDGLPVVDYEQMLARYLAAYRSVRPLDSTNLDYYRVRRCVMALMEGVEGQEIWQHPPMVRDLLAYIRDVTGVTLSMPG